MNVAAVAAFDVRCR